ncbi:MAG: T9SS type A sorting domain-containing protein, partial [Fibrobacteres bacterium]|nr:T9SS type A sorting domain-containing protein [Fibrobacterota bacterium]
KTPYSEQGFTFKDSMWKNLYPAGKLGVWGDTTGFADSCNWSPYMKVELHNGIVRPSLGHVYDSRSHYQYAWDSDMKKVYYYILNHTYSYTPATRTWEVINPSTAPGGLPNGKMIFYAAAYRLRWSSLVYDPVNKEILLFGGGGVDAPKGNVGTWIYKPSTNTWTKLLCPVEPTPRALSQLVYDAKNKVIVLFSGDHMDSLLGDTWIYNCETKAWIRKHPAISPKPRAGHAMLYLPKSGKVVMMGGYTYHLDSLDRSRDRVEYDNFANFEMWTYDISSSSEGSWTLIKRFSSAEPMNSGSTTLPAAADSSDRIVVIGEPSNSTRYYQYNSTWLMDCDPNVADPSGTIAYGWKTDSNLARIKRWDPAWFKKDDATVDTGAQENLLRNLTPNTWTYIPQPKVPLECRAYGKAAISTDRGIIFHWGGGHAEVNENDMPEYDIKRNRWSIGYAGETSFEFCGANQGGPPATVTFNGNPFMFCHAYDTYDYCPILKKFLLYHHKETYVYNPDTKGWDTTRILHHPTMRGDDFRRALNSTPRGMVCWTQTLSGYGLWLLDTVTLAWKPLPVKNGTAVPFTYCEQACMVYDSKRDRLIMANANGSDPWTVRSTGQVWDYRFSDSTCNKLNPADTALVYKMVYFRDAVYLPKSDQVLFQDTIVINGVKGLALYDCASNRWKGAPVQSDNSSYPLGWGTSSNSTALLYDSKRDLVYAVTYGNRIYAMKYEDKAFAVTNEDVAKQQRPFSLMSASPNPYTSSVSLSVILNFSTKNLLTVHNALGQQIADLTEQLDLNKAGVLQTVNLSKVIKANSIYFIRLKSGTEYKQLKIISVR